MYIYIHSYIYMFVYIYMMYVRMYVSMYIRIYISTWYIRIYTSTFTHTCHVISPVLYLVYEFHTGVWIPSWAILKGACRNGGKPTTDMRTSTSVHTHVAATTEYTIYGIRVCNTYRACAELARNKKKCILYVYIHKCTHPCCNDNWMHHILHSCM